MSSCKNFARYKLKPPGTPWMVQRFPANSPVEGMVVVYPIIYSVFLNTSQKGWEWNF